MGDTPGNGAAVDAARNVVIRNSVLLRDGTVIDSRSPLHAIDGDDVDRKATHDVVYDAFAPAPEAIRAYPPLTAVVRDADTGEDGRPIMDGYFSRFDEWTEIDSVFEGRFMERVAPRAYRKTLNEHRDDIRVLFQHGQDPQVGDKPIGEIIDVRETDEGVFAETRLFDGLPPLILEGLRAGQYGQSFRMRVMREDIVPEPDPSEANPLGLPERTIKEIRLYEFGPVTFPAYKNTTPSIRSLTDEFVFDWLAREPERARALIGAYDLSMAARAAAATDVPAASVQSDAAPVDTPALVAGAVLPGTLGSERRDPAGYGLTPSTRRPPWAL